MTYNNNPAFTKVDCNLIPHETFKMLRQASYDKRLPVSLLLAIALDNELDAPNPFYYPVDLIPSGVDSSAFTNEANKIFRYLEKHRKGMDKESIMLCRRDIGILDRNAVVGGISELLKGDLVEIFEPRRTSFSYDRDYRRIRVKEDENTRKARYRSNLRMP